MASGGTLGESFFGVCVVRSEHSIIMAPHSHQGWEKGLMAREG
jgi:hypothetical protein